MKMMSKEKIFNIYHNQKSTTIKATCFAAAFASEKTWYTKGTVLFIEKEDTGIIKKFIV